MNGASDDEDEDDDEAEAAPPPTPPPTPPRLPTDDGAMVVEAAAVEKRDPLGNTTLLRVGGDVSDPSPSSAGEEDKNVVLKLFW